MTDANSDDIHTNELGIDLPPAALVATALGLFSAAVEARWPWLDGVVLMLMIPLRDSLSLCRAPRWHGVPKLLSRTPPSFYLLRPRSYFQFDDSTRLVEPVEGLPSLPPGAFAEYRCWRTARHAPEEGWARDVRVVSIER